ncbi:MAG: hypothetical protein JWM86_619 [Thermoleophilia bacterium]|nr:hypothetical protein [Thermoleophilia bacterium]
MAGGQLTRPARVVRARMATMRAKRAHRAEVARGAGKDASSDRTPIFILGAPRSGTTLLYQLLIEGFDVGWLANAHAARPSEVAEVERVEQPRAARTSSDWESSHGRTREPWGPSEAEGYWYRFFDREPHEVTAENATMQRVTEIRRSVREFADACCAPVVFKNVFNSLRIPVLARALPEARFIHIERSLEPNARSLLVGRVQRGDVGVWWSAAPDGADALKDASPAEQVTWQVEQMNRVAARELAHLQTSQVLLVHYDELCADPRGVLDRIEAWLVQGGVEIRRRADAVLPEQFERRAGGTLPAELEAELAAAVAAAATRIAADAPNDGVAP